MAAAQDRTREWEAISHDIFMGRDPQKHHHHIPEEEDYDTDSTASDEYSDNNDGFGYSSSPEYLAINLIAMIHDDQDDDQFDNDANIDSWMQAALALSASINEVSLMIESKSASYLNCTSDTFHIFFGHHDNHNNNDNDYGDETTTSNADRSILETTVASFAAGMAKQIESLRQTVVVEGDHPFINSADDNNELDEATQRLKWANGPIGHRAGIASCLMQRLKSEIMDPMTTLTSQREKSQSRGNYSMDEPTKIAQNPLLGFFSGATLDVTERSNHHPPPPAPWELGDHDPEQEKYERDQEQEEFLRIYGETDNTPTNASSLESIITNTFPPLSVLELLDTPTPQVKSNTQHDEPPVPKILSPPPPAVQQFKKIPDVMMPPQQHNEEEHMDQLQRESATLLATYQHSDLEGVQKVERSMTEITQLLSRFTDLITEQQEDIFMIHDQAIKSKENVDKGQDQLVDAVARGKKSTHPMATFIVLAAVLLLLFNWITP
ncbi:SNARE domain-containing protein [Skeletonema marinoi]|uniref:SNARE domain-containing protein n=1 Tax=Skeletonema marinoi TaxID=267567 RepID=A0AAD8Y7Z8_9STRA|nr:SNARE domain-containing protein [Skeletonema marinoi]